LERRNPLLNPPPQGGGRLRRGRNKNKKKPSLVLIPLPLFNSPPPFREKKK